MVGGACEPSHTTFAQFCRYFHSNPLRLVAQDDKGEVYVVTGWRSAKQCRTRRRYRGDGNIGVAPELASGEIDLPSGHQRQRIACIRPRCTKAGSKSCIFRSTQFAGTTGPPATSGVGFPARSRQIGNLEFDVRLLSHVFLPGKRGNATASRGVLDELEPIAVFVELARHEIRIEPLSQLGHRARDAVSNSPVIDLAHRGHLCRGSGEKYLVGVVQI